MKKCPPGVICVENISLFLLFLIMLLLVGFIYMNLNKSKNINVTDTNNITIETRKETNGGFFNGFLPSWPYTNLPNDVLLNPYAPPLSDERYIVSNVASIATPINVSTNIGAVNTSYRQMGIITPLNETSTNNILPLMGRPLYTNRNKWQYYTISNQHNNVKLPISFKGKSALNDYGVDQIYNGDTVYVEGYNDAFKTTIYENDTIKYLPFF
jgi:hypothetical protein